MADIRVKGHLLRTEYWGIHGEWRTIIIGRIPAEHPRGTAGAEWSYAAKTSEDCLAWAERNGLEPALPTSQELVKFIDGYPAEFVVP
jgi:hypothetical protein